MKYGFASTINLYDSLQQILIQKILEKGHTINKMTQTENILSISKEYNLEQNRVKAVVTLLNDGATIPFIARYRKEVSGSMDEVAITSIRDRLNQIEELSLRKKAILKSIEKSGQLTAQLKEKIKHTSTLAVLEDIYLPYKQKKKTKAAIAKEQGLFPLAKIILKQDNTDPQESASQFINIEKNVTSEEDAIAGARNIIAEIINEDEEVRKTIRNFFETKAYFTSKIILSKKEDPESQKYKDYFDLTEPVSSAPSHRVLAMLRGEKENILKLAVSPDMEKAISLIESIYISGQGKKSCEIKKAISDSYKRLISKSMENEIRTSAKKKADTEAINIFAQNLRQLLLAPPLGQKNVMGIDPGFRTGCKVVCLNMQGKLLCSDTIFPHNNHAAEKTGAGKKIEEFCKKYNIEAIAIGNKTAGRETELFVKSLNIPMVTVYSVEENGASIYSASKTARDEFPDQDITVRGTVSIARRLMDPLSELLKIDPKSIGVGQYQHDVDQKILKTALEDVVSSCVNQVGVDINLASVQLLSHISGIGPKLAQNIVAFKNENGPFKTRTNIKKVPRLGPKAFEQAAGFLRINNGKNPLDGSSVHPESYNIVYKIAKDQNCDLIDLIGKTDLKNRINLTEYITETTGLPTLNDILSELAKPGRDPREKIEKFEFAEEINTISDLYEGITLPGIITNITAFGAFVDIGVHTDGLLHISQISNNFVKDPAKLLKIHQKVKVEVIKVEKNRKRISLSMKKNHEKKSKKQLRPDKNHSVQKKPFNSQLADLLK